MDGWKTSFLLGWPIFRCYVGFLYHLLFFLFWMAYVQAFFSLGSIGAWSAVLEDKELYESRPDGAFSSQQAKKKHGDQPFCPSKNEKNDIVTLGLFFWGAPFFLEKPPPPDPRLSPRKKPHGRRWRCAFQMNVWSSMMAWPWTLLRHLRAAKLHLVPWDKWRRPTHPKNGAKKTPRRVRFSIENQKKRVFFGCDFVY